MGQYFIIVNSTKKEFIHPHCLGNGLKFLEFAVSQNTPLALCYLLRQSNSSGGGDIAQSVESDSALYMGSWAGDSIAVVGDYDSSELYELAEKEYKNISHEVTREYNKLCDYPDDKITIEYFCCNHREGRLADARRIKKQMKEYREKQGVNQ